MGDEVYIYIHENQAVFCFVPKASIDLVSWHSTYKNLPYRPRAGKARYTQSLAAISLQIPVARSNHTLTVWGFFGMLVTVGRMFSVMQQVMENTSLLVPMQGVQFRDSLGCERFYSNWHDWFSSSLQFRIVEVGKNLRFHRFCRFPHIGFKYDDILTRLGWTVFKTWVALLWTFIVYHRYHSLNLYPSLSTNRLKSGCATRFYKLTSCKNRNKSIFFGGILPTQPYFRAAGGWWNMQPELRLQRHWHSW